MKYIIFARQPDVLNNKQLGYYNGHPVVFCVNDDGTEALWVSNSNSHSGLASKYLNISTEGQFKISISTVETFNRIVKTKIPGSKDHFYLISAKEANAAKGFLGKPTYHFKTIKIIDLPGLIAKMEIQEMDVTKYINLDRNYQLNVHSLLIENKLTSNYYPKNDSTPVNNQVSPHQDLSRTVFFNQDVLQTNLSSEIKNKSEYIDAFSTAFETYKKMYGNFNDELVELELNTNKSAAFKEIIEAHYQDYGVFPNAVRFAFADEHYLYGIFIKIKLQNTMCIFGNVHDIAHLKDVLIPLLNKKTLNECIIEQLQENVACIIVPTYILPLWRRIMPYFISTMIPIKFINELGEKLNNIINPQLDKVLEERYTKFILPVLCDNVKEKLGNTEKYIDLILWIRSAASDPGIIKNRGNFIKEKLMVEDVRVSADINMFILHFIGFIQGTNSPGLEKESDINNLAALKILATTHLSNELSKLEKLAGDRNHQPSLIEILRENEDLRKKNAQAEEKLMKIYLYVKSKYQDDLSMIDDIPEDHRLNTLPNVYYGKLPNDKDPIMFEENFAPHSKDGGFIALRTDRHTLIETLLPLRDNPNALLFLADEIFASIVSGKEFTSLPEVSTLRKEYLSAQKDLNAVFSAIQLHLPEDKKKFSLNKLTDWLRDQLDKNEEYKAIYSARYKVQYIKDELKNLCKLPQIYESYVQAFKEDLYLGDKSALLFAKTKGIFLYLWIKNKKNPQQIDLINHCIPEVPSGQIIHILHTNGNHCSVLSQKPLQVEPKRLSHPVDDDKIDHLTKQNVNKRPFPATQEKKSKISNSSSVYHGDGPALFKYQKSDAHLDNNRHLVKGYRK